MVVNGYLDIKSAGGTSINHVLYGDLKTTASNISQANY